MKRLCWFTTVSVALLLVVSMGIRYSSPAFSAVLESFTINTDDDQASKAVTVTLHADQRLKYTTESKGRQFIITLPEASLSKEQLENGLPVVIDNKNKIIGRAVNTDDGHVKIILPNLPSNEYAVSVQQQVGGQAATVAANKPAVKTGGKLVVNMPAVKSNAATSIPAVQPRASVTLGDNQFEKVASQVIRQSESPRSASPSGIRLSNAPEDSAPSGPQITQNAPIRLGPTPISSSYGGSKSIWNPYVVKPASRTQKATSRPSAPAATNDEPLNAVSMAAPDSSPGFMASQPATTPANDPLWYLHSLAPSSPNAIVPPADSLQGPAAQGLTLDSSGLLQPQQPGAAQTPQPVIQQRSLVSDVREAFQGLPKWLVVLATFFIGGIGLFTLLGSMVLIRFLFMQLRIGGPKAQPVQAFNPAAMPVNPVQAAGLQPPYAYAPQGMMPQEMGAPHPGKANGYSTAPAKPQISFKDTAAVNAMDYLKSAPDSVSEAVQNAVLVKFPGGQQQRRHGMTGLRRQGARR